MVVNCNECLESLKEQHREMVTRLGKLEEKVLTPHERNPFPSWWIEVKILGLTKGALIQVLGPEGIIEIVRIEITHTNYIISFDSIINIVTEMATRHCIKEVRIDPWASEGLTKRLRAAGLIVKEERLSKEGRHTI